MADLLDTRSFPPGIRFYPTDEELFMYYLKRKVLGKSLSPEMIAEVDVYRFAPWDLPAMASSKSRDLNWYFFCPRGRKYPNGGRANRATVYGYWKSTGNDRTMVYNSRPVGKIKTLIFHRGKAPKGERTDWVMHEYRLEDEVLARKGIAQDAYVICKIYEKSGLGPKNGENHCARFIEEEWDSDDENNVQERGPEVVSVGLGPQRVGDSPGGSISGLTSVAASPNFAPPVVSPTVVDVPDVNVSFPNTAAASAGAPFTTCVDNPNITCASPGTAFVLTPSSAPPTTATGAPAAVGASDDDELDRLLSFFTEDLPSGGDFFNDLADLRIPSGLVDFDWSDILEMDDLK